MYEVEAMRALLIHNSKIMRPTGTPAFLASLVLLATAARAHHTCGYRPSPSPSPSPSPPPCDYSTPGIQSAISSGAEVVTYGEPCFCKESIPYSIQVPKVEHHHRIEKLGTYGYAVDMPAQQPERYLQLPVQIQTPIEHRSYYDNLRGKSYSVMVQHQEHRSDPKRMRFDCAVQAPVKVEKRTWKPSMSFSIQHQEERINPRFSPLPIAVQTPIQTESKSIKLTPLSGTVDRVLVPACEINSCPDCNDIVVRKHSPPPPPPPAYSPCY